MLDSTSGFVIESESESDPKLRFCSEGCQSLLGEQQPLELNTLVKKPLTEVNFPIISDTSRKGITTEVTATHLLSIKLSVQGTDHYPPTHGEIDVYRIEKGAALQSGRLFTLFDLRSLSDQIFGEFFLTDELSLDGPLPHYTIQLKKDSVLAFHMVLCEGIRRSGLAVNDICCLGVARVTVDVTVDATSIKAPSDSES